MEMTQIQGVGDEVTNFFIVVVVLLVGWLAWYSTSIIDHPLILTLPILQHRTHTHNAELTSNYQNTNISQASNMEISQEESVEPITENNSNNSQSCPEPSVAESHRIFEATATEEVLIEAMDSFNNVNTPLLQKQTKIDTTEETSIPTSACIDNVECRPENLSTNDANEISIKLKFINDDEKVVIGSLNELLGDFKRRHFQTELDEQKLVRLIFKGRILQTDNQTLEQCGLYNNCVVHCLIHQPKPSSIPPRTSTLDNSSAMYIIPVSISDIPAALEDVLDAREISSVHNEWDLSRLLVCILTLIIGVAWYTLYYRVQLFTAISTLALYTLTTIFTVSLFSHFSPDHDNIRNVP
ncbi:transmembrane and ubiquitin-like domain-containing protein 1 isoform X2 [Colletes gigas]|uniref:transmembrane and ubiquitin-like domain-containing protein 1 isoform X2 n=1 Tax=Colletes gigas TaxID=935657 RepID=UPI001C9A2F60|nr:transmembrane and ubiquitin-like domain-containing protein 1 isoform X2 [Colletes gigas]